MTTAGGSIENAPNPMMGVAQGASCIMSAGERRARFQTGRAHEANIYIGLTLEGKKRGVTYGLESHITGLEV